MVVPFGMPLLEESMPLKHLIFTQSNRLKQALPFIDCDRVLVLHNDLSCYMMTVMAMTQKN